MTITSTTNGVTDGSTTNNATIALTLTSSEATTTFAEADITVSGGAISNFAATKGAAVYTATFTPTASEPQRLMLQEEHLQMHQAITIPPQRSSTGLMMVQRQR